MTLAWILAASVAGGTLSVGLAAFSLYLRASWMPILVSYAIGALLGAAFLEVIPHAFELGTPRQASWRLRSRTWLASERRQYLCNAMICSSIIGFRS